MKLWQLKNLNTNEALNEPQPLPENWGPIFGLHGFMDRIGDLSWLGEAYEGQGWVEVGDAPEPVEPVGPSAAEIAIEQATAELRACDWTMLPDAPLTVGQKQAWAAYRLGLMNVKTQAGFPNSIQWPAKPE